MGFVAAYLHCMIIKLDLRSYEKDHWSLFVPFVMFPGLVLDKGESRSLPTSNGSPPAAVPPSPTRRAG